MMKIVLISDDEKYNLLKISKGIIYEGFNYCGDEMITIINDVCINKRVSLKDFKIIL